MLELTNFSVDSEFITMNDLALRKYLVPKKSFIYKRFAAYI